MFLMVLLFAVWSSVFPLGKMMLAYSTPLFLTGFRMCLGGVLLLGFLAFRKKFSFSLTKQQFFSLISLGFFSIYLTNILEFWGLQYLSAAKTCFLYSLSPFFAALFSYLHFGEKMSPRKWLGFGIGFLGILPVLWLQTGSEESLSTSAFLSWPTLAVVGAVLTSVYGWVLLRVLVKDQELSPLFVNGGSMLFGGILALLHSFFVDTWNPWPVISAGAAPFLQGNILMAFLFNILCYNCYGMLLKRYTATLLSFVGLLSPIFASLTGLLFLGEPLSPLIFLSTAVVSIGIFIIHRTEIKQGYIPS